MEKSKKNLFNIKETNKIETLIYILFLIGLFLIPFLKLNNYYMNIIIKVLIYTVMALGLNILVGYTGLVSLGIRSNWSIHNYNFDDKIWC